MSEEIIERTQEKMQKAVEAFQRDLTGIRTGRANASLLDSIKVDVYGQSMPINNVASVTVSDARTIQVSVWDANNIKLVDSAILNSDLSLNPRVDGNNLFITLPELTSDRRQELVKTLKKKAEDSKVAIRNIRRDGNDDIKALEKDKSISEDDSKAYQEDIQKATDGFVNKIDTITQNKSKEIETI